MKIPLVGESYTMRSPAAGYQQSINVMPQFIDDPNGSGKNHGILQGCPGMHQIATLAGGSVRGFWSGGGRLFAVGGNHLYEVGIGTYIEGVPYSSGAGTIISDWDMGIGDTNPVQMFGNGNQLAIINAGYLFVSNGAAPFRVRFQLNGTFTTADGINLVWSSGDVFTAAMVGITLIFAGNPFTVFAFTDSHHIALALNCGVQATPVAYSAAGGDYVTCVTGAYLDSALFVQRPITAPPDLGRQVNYSAVGDLSHWNGLDFFTKEGYADHIQSILADKEQLYIFGTESGEVWQNDSSTGLPVRIPGAAMRQGSLSRYAPVSLGGKVFFIGGGPTGSPIAYRLDGFTPVRVSTHAVEAAWAALSSTPAGCVAFPDVEDGHLLWVINFTVGSLGTWVYDETASQQAGSPMWHQRSHWSGSVFQPYLCWYHTFIPEWGAAGMHIGGRFNSGAIYDMNLAYADEGGVDRKWIRQLPALYNNGKRMYGGRMTLEMATGTWLTPGGVGAEPVITRDYSDDQGKTFYNPQTAGIGTPGDSGTGIPGDTQRRVYWPTSGSWPLSRIFRISGVGQVPITLIDMNLDVTLGSV